MFGKFLGSQKVIDRPNLLGKFLKSITMGGKHGDSYTIGVVTSDP
jgi:hypothetical protein